MPVVFRAFYVGPFLHCSIWTTWTMLHSQESIYKNPKRLSVPRSQRALTLYPETDCATGPT